MLKRQYLTPPKQPTTIIYELVIVCFKHIYIYGCQIQLLKLYESLVCLVKTFALALWDHISLGAVFFLLLLVSKMICPSYLREIVHILGP